MKELNIDIYRNPDGSFCCTSVESVSDCFLTSWGKTLEESKEDLYVCYQELKEMNDEEGKPTEDVEFIFNNEIKE